MKGTVYRSAAAGAGLTRRRFGALAWLVVFAALLFVILLAISPSFRAWWSS